MKKLLNMMLSVAMIMGLMTGCGSSSEGSSDASTEQTTQSSTVSDISIGTSDKSVEELDETITVSHTYGETTLPKNPKKIAVFDMGVLDSINALGVDVEVGVPVNSLPESLANYENAEDLGSIKEPNMENVYEFEPDIIIISGRQADYYDELSKIAPTWYFEINTDTLLEDFEANYTILGEILGMEDQTTELIENSIEKVNETAEKAKDIEEKALILLTNDGTISAYGKGSRFGLIHDQLNVPVADESIDVSTHGQEVGYEYISNINPDIIFVVDRTTIVGGTTESSDTLDNELVKSTNAYKNDKIVYLDAERWYLVGFGLNSLPQMVDEISAAIF